MTRLKYTLRETEASWTEHLYHASIPVVGGIAEVEDPLSVEALLYRGFEIVEDVAEAVAEVADEVAETVVAAAEAVVEAVTGDE